MGYYTWYSEKKQQFFLEEEQKLPARPLFGGAGRLRIILAALSLRPGQLRCAYAAGSSMVPMKKGRLFSQSMSM